MVKSAELKKFNFRSASDATLAINPDSVPTLAPADALEAFRFEDDPDPYFKIQAIDYPTKANGYMYTEAFWKSLLARIAERPIPGSARGHTTAYGARGATDLLLIGGKLDPKGGGEGTVYLKNYIPPVGESGDNGTFIAMNKAGMVDYSIVAYTKDQVTTLPDGSSLRLVMECIGGERNDAVDFGTGAMDQKTNTRDPEQEDPGTGIRMESYAPDAAEDAEIPEIHIGSAGPSQDSGDEIPTIRIGGTK